MTKLMLVLLFAGGAWAQGPILVPPVAVFPDLVAYLGLTPAQLVQLGQPNATLATFVAEKSRRMDQVNREIAEETAKSPLDPTALGLRYAELEEIRREIRAEEEKTHEQVLAVLNDAQKAKLKTLEDAMKLQPLISEAQSARLLERVPSPFFNIIPVSRCVPIP